MQDNILTQHQEQEPKGDALRELITLCDRLEELVETKNEKEEELKNLGEQIKNLKQKLIPDLMGEIGIESLSLSSGKKVFLRDFYYPHVTKEQEEAFFHWLRENNHGSLLREQLIVDERFEEEAKDYFRKKYPNEQALIEKATIHPMTLRAWVKEMVEKEEPLPDTINVHMGKEVHVK